jgi:transposase
LRKILVHESPPGYCGRKQTPHDNSLNHSLPHKPLSKSVKTKKQWMEWLYLLEQNPHKAFDERINVSELRTLLFALADRYRQRSLVILAKKSGFSLHAISTHLGIDRKTARAYVKLFSQGGPELLFGRNRKVPRKADNEAFKKALFALLHEPPSLSGFNRTTWRMADLRSTLRERGHPACASVIREAIKKAGYRWRSAKVVLTSNDPDYREKLERVHSVLGSLRETECFFSIDEFGPFAIKAKPGRVLAEPGVIPSIPQWQKSKGWLIVTAALELSTNQVTHFYSRKKNTKEMIRMAQLLTERYRSMDMLYLSWDAASWHMSKDLLTFVEGHNANETDSPNLALIPLPASAQFLNVVESVFSGMARAIVHNSNYGSMQEASDAIDRYFAERNEYYIDNPRRAGRKIWGAERTAPSFDSANNCKDPSFR